MSAMRSHHSPARNMIRFVCLFSLLAPVLCMNESESYGSSSSASAQATRRAQLSDLDPDSLSHIMTFNTAVQGLLTSCCVPFKVAADILTPCQNELLENLKIPQLKTVPVHIDLEVLDGFVFPDTREGKFHTLILFWNRLSDSLSRSPIRDHLSTIYYDELLKLAPSLTPEEWKLLGFESTDDLYYPNFAQMVKHFADKDRLHDLYQLMTTSQIRMPSVYGHSVFYSSNIDPLVSIGVKLVGYLRDKPTDFRQMIKVLDQDTLPILVACDYEADHVSAILEAGNEYQNVDQFLEIISKALKKDTSHLGEDMIFYLQLSFVLNELRRLNPNLSQELTEKADLVASWISMRYNPHDEHHIQARPDITSCIALMRSKNYIRAVQLLPDEVKKPDLEILISDPEFVGIMVQKKTKAWIRKVFRAYRNGIWKHHCVIEAFYGINSIETEFSKIIDKTADKKVIQMWREILPTLFQVGSVADFRNYMVKVKHKDIYIMFRYLFESFENLSPERFKVFLLELISVVNESTTNLFPIPIAVPFELSQVILEDTELYTGITGIRNEALKLCYEAEDFKAILNDNQKFEFLMNHRREWSRLMSASYQLPLSCTSPLEIARAYKLMGNGRSKERFFGQALKHKVKFHNEWFFSRGDLKFTNQLVAIYADWRILNKVKVINGLPQDLEVLEQQARQKIKDPSVLIITKFMTEKQKRNYFSAILLEPDHFAEY